MQVRRPVRRPVLDVFMCRHAIYCTKLWNLFSLVPTILIAITFTYHICNHHHTINRTAFVCLSVCLFAPYLLRGPFTDLRQTWRVYVGGPRNCPWGVLFRKGQRLNGSLSLSTILYMCQPHSTQVQKATLLLLHLIRLKGTFCCIDGWWVYVGGSRNCLLDG